MNLVELPLGIDIHVHYRSPGHPEKETLETGYQASIHGGVGTVIDMPNTNPPIDTVKRFQTKSELLSNKYQYIHLAAAITNQNILSGELQQLAAHAKVYKLFMANSTGDLGISYENLRTAFETLEHSNSLIMVHAEDPKFIQNRSLSSSENDIRPVKAEVSAIHTLIELKEEFPKTNLHLTHISSYQGAKLIIAEQNISWDVLHKHLAFDSTMVEKLGNFAKMNPPLRPVEERRKLYELFMEGQIPIISSDHAPHTKKDKNSPVAGAPGAQELYPFLIDEWRNEKISLETLKNMIFENPKRLLQKHGLDYLKGKVIVNTDEEYIINSDIKSKVGWSLWEDHLFRGKIIKVEY